MEQSLTPVCDSHVTQSVNHVTSNQNNTWGILRRIVNGVQKDIVLEHRFKNDRRDTYVIGRSRSCDITVEDKRVSSSHCMIYCDYSDVRLRVFIEDKSANGTFINDSLTRITSGNRMELKSADEIFLINPRNMLTPSDRLAAFTFINMRERLVAQREIESAAIAPTVSTITTKTGEVVTNIPSQIQRSSTGGISFPHIEDFYIIGEQIGSGMSGQVYFCMHRATGKQCAVKIIDTRKFNLNNTVKGLSVVDLMEEATIIQQLDHPNIITVLDTFRTDQAIHIVMELLKGGDLFDRIVEKGRYTEANARKIMVKILSAVSYLHANNIIHRDLKPENILLVASNDDTEIKLTDFGLAKKADHDGLKTFCGTPQYFAPEVLRRKGTVNGEGRYGTAADMWSLGVVLYILLTGTFPFDEDHLFDQIKSATYSMDGIEWKHISDAAKDLVQRLLKLRADRRITVDEAIKHPWIQNINFNDGAFKANAKPPQYKQFTKSSTLGGGNKWLTEGDKKNSKPPIGTVALFLTKKPSLQKQQQQQQVQRQQSTYEQLSLVPSSSSSSAAISTEVSIELVPATTTEEAELVPLVNSQLTDDEIEDCSESDEDSQVRDKVSEETDKKTSSKSKTVSKSERSRKKKKKAEPSDVPVEATDTTLPSNAVGGSGVVKRQKTLADAWSKLVTVNNKTEES